MMALAQNKDFNAKYVYHEEFHNENLNPINLMNLLFMNL
jgi:hypothetical protein